MLCRKRKQRTRNEWKGAWQAMPGLLTKMELQRAVTEPNQVLIRLKARTSSTQRVKAAETLRSVALSRVTDSAEIALQIAMALVQVKLQCK